jgi:hypothetical protein
MRAIFGVFGSCAESECPLHDVALIAMAFIHLPLLLTSRTPSPPRTPTVKLPRRTT